MIVYYLKPECPPSMLNKILRMMKNQKMEQITFPKSKMKKHMTSCWSHLSNSIVPVVIDPNKCTYLAFEKKEK